MDDYLESFREETGQHAMNHLEREVTAIRVIKEIVDELGGEASHVGAALKGFSDLAYHNIENQVYDTPFYCEERYQLLQSLNGWRDRAEELLKSQETITKHCTHRADESDPKMKKLLELNDEMISHVGYCRYLLETAKELNETPS